MLDESTSEEQGENFHSVFENATTLKPTRTCNLEGKKLTFNDKFYIADMYLYLKKKNKMTGRKFARSKNIDEKTLRRWVNQRQEYVQRGVNTVYDGPGNPPILDKDAEKQILDSVTDLVRTQKTPSTAKVEDMVVHGVRETLRRRGMVKNCDSVSKSYLRSLFHKLRLHKCKVQTKTSARIEAEADPRNMYSMICLVKAFCENLPPRLIFNWDATQYITSNDLHATGVYIESMKSHNIAITSESNGTMAIAVKMFHCHNAAGYSTKPVFVIADDEMGEEEFKVFLVRGLGNNNVNRSNGWLCFTKTRACNRAFYRWFATEIVCKFVKKSRDSQPLKPNEDFHAFVTCDGEARQLEAFMEDDIRTLLDTENIILAKIPASCSGISQPSDVSDFFKASKKRLEYLPRSLRDNSVVKARPNMTVEEEDELEQQIGEYPDADIVEQLDQILKETSFTSDKKGKIIDALQRIAWVIRTTLTLDMVRQGYQRVGWVPKPSLRKAMGKCTKALSTEEYNNLEEHWQELASCYIQKGELTETDMDKVGIVGGTTGRNKKPKNDRPLHQQRAVMINHPFCVTKYLEYKARKEEEKIKNQKKAIATDIHRRNKLVYSKWYETLSLGERANEDKLLRKGKKARWAEKTNEWKNLGPEACPWLGGLL